MSAREDMLAGRVYDPGDGELVALRKTAQGLMRERHDPCLNLKKL